MNNCVDPELLDEGGWADGRTDKNITFVLETPVKSGTESNVWVVPAVT